MQDDAKPSVPSERLHGLDAYRGVLMVLGIVLHTVLSYTSSAWPFTDNTAIDDELGILSRGIHMFRMPAFFLLSGFFGALLWERHGPRAMLKNRVQRIVLPFAVFVMLLWPAIVFCFTFGHAAMSGLPSPLTYALSEVVDGGIFPHDTMHLWFLYDLALITVVWSVLMATGRWFKLSQERLLAVVRRTFECPWLFTIVVGGINLLWCIVNGWEGIPTSTQWLPEDFEQVAIIVYYLLWYVLGWAIFASKAAIATAQKRAWTLTGWGVFSVYVFDGVDEALDGGETASVLTETVQVAHAGFMQGGFDAFVQLVNEMLPQDTDFWMFGGMFWGSLAVVTLTRGLMGLFLRYAGSGAYFWRYISDSSYWVYLLHLPLTVLVPSLLFNWHVPVFIKFPTAMLLISGLCWSTYDCMVRPTFVGQFLNGRRYPARAPQWSMAGSLLAVAVLCWGMIQYPPPLDRPPPWREARLPSELLDDLSVEYPVTTDEPPPVGLPVSRCAGVGRYIVCPDDEEFEWVDEACDVFGASLAVYETESESDEVSRLLKRLTPRSFWVPVTDEEVEGEWVWPDGSKLSYDRWAEAEPNDWGDGEDCAASNWEGTSDWNDLPCGARQGFVCELAEPGPAQEAVEQPDK